jgi:hypothetical protein
MRRIPQIATIATGMIIALRIMAYWDVRQADMLCDIGQDPSHICQHRFIELDRLKQILHGNERKLAR